MKQARPSSVAPERPSLPAGRPSSPGWQQTLAPGRLPAWVLLPLRLFLGVTFVYAGLQKLTDPHYFRKGTASYIGTQITSFAHGTPLSGLLLNVALPHAQFFGALIALGELAIGLGTLASVLMRPAAFFGALLSLIFFLSASWRVQPYFYGADIVFLFAWITLLLAGPASGGWPMYDARLAERALATMPAPRRPQLARVLAVVLGVTPATVAPEPLTAVPAATQAASGRQPAARRPVVGPPTAPDRGRTAPPQIGPRGGLKGVGRGGGGQRG
ncbi:MAG: TQO small subunit DoxD, partial [Ktedonobacterales bacterium]